MNHLELFADRLKQRDPNCLHCWILAAIEAHGIANSQRVGDDLHLDGNLTIAALSAVIAHLLAAAPMNIRSELAGRVQSELREHLEPHALH